MRKKFILLVIVLILLIATLTGCDETKKYQGSSSSTSDKNAKDNTVKLGDYKISGAIEEVEIQNIELVTEYNETNDTESANGWKKVNGFVTIMRNLDPEYPVAHQRKIVKGTAKNIAGKPFLAVKFTVYYRDDAGERVQTKSYNLYRQGYVSGGCCEFEDGETFDFSVEYERVEGIDLAYDKAVDVDEINIKILSYGDS